MTTIIDGILFFAVLVSLMTENETASEDFVLGRMAGVNPIKTQKNGQQKGHRSTVSKEKACNPKISATQG